MHMCKSLHFGRIMLECKQARIYIYISCHYIHCSYSISSIQAPPAGVCHQSSPHCWSLSFLADLLTTCVKTVHYCSSNIYCLCLYVAPVCMCVCVVFFWFFGFFFGGGGGGGGGVGLWVISDYLVVYAEFILEIFVPDI